MTATRPIFPVSVSFTLILLLSGYALGQFNEAYNPPGYILEWDGWESGVGTLSNPQDVAVDASGNVYVADTDNHRVLRFDSVGNYITHWGSQGFLPGMFWEPFGVAVNDLGFIYVIDTGNDRIQKFNSAGNHLDDWEYGEGADGFNQPRGLALGYHNGLDGSPQTPVYLYTADTDNHRIVKTLPDGREACDPASLCVWGGYGSGPGEFDTPRAVAADASGNVYVADTQNNRIQKFDSNGNYLTEWGGSGEGSGQFASPLGIAVDLSGAVREPTFSNCIVYVADTENHRIQRFDCEGEFLTEWGSYGDNPGQFRSPAGIAVDRWGDVYVADSVNDRIQKFGPVREFVVDGYDSRIRVTTSHSPTTVRTQLQLENRGAPRFALKNTSSDIEWSFQQSGPGNFLISKEGTGGPELQVYQTGMVRMGPGGTNNFTLYPNGNLTIAGSLTANGSTFPDYVFESDYDLMPLSNLRTFIQQEKRLPNIPSAEEVKQQGGHNMTELQLKLLEKIEELTLYTLEQEKKLDRVESLERENTQMKAELAEIRAMLSDR